jgi:hypothetical protein
MKSVNLFLVLTFVIMTHISNCQQVESKLQLTSRLMATYHLCQYDSNYYFLVEVNLLNNSDSSYSFVAFRCGTNNSVYIESEQIEICQSNCSSSNGTLISIKPHQSFSMPIILKAKQKCSAVNNFIRLGVILLPPKGYESVGETLFKMKRSKRNILWGNSFILSDADCQPYDIK